MNLVLVEASELAADGTAHLSGERARHLRTVLRVATGSSVRIGLVDGAIGHGVVVGMDDHGVTLQCELASEPPPPPAVDLLLALPRPKVLRRLWAQLAALGVGRVMLTNAERVERNYFDTHVLGEACYRPLFIEGLQQSRDTRLPVVSVHRQFRVLVEDELDVLAPETHRVVAHPTDAVISVGERVRNRARRRVLLAVGPEGGWNEFELSLLRARGFELAGMGPRTLRSDTAVIALLALVHDALSPCLARGSGDHHLGGLDDGHGVVAALQVERTDGVSGDDGSEGLIADAQADLGEQAVDADFIDGAVEAITRAEAGDGLVGVRMPGACARRWRVARCQALDLGFSDAVVPTLGARRADAPSVHPALERRVRDTEAIGGRTNGQLGHGSR